MHSTEAIGLVDSSPPPFNLSAASVVKTLGLSSGLKLCLDPGDAASYSSGQKWLDLSGGGYDFFRGADGTSEASDPTFTGTPGALSSAEGFSYDGGDFCTYDSANETWMEDIHKANALYTFAVWFKPGSLASNQNLLVTRSGVNTGFAFAVIATSGRPSIGVSNGSVSTVFTPVTVGGANLVVGTWAYVAFSVDIAGNAQVGQKNGTQASGAASYSSPASGAAFQTLTVGATSFLNGGVMGPVMIWNAALSAAQLNSIWTTMRGRFGV